MKQFRVITAVLFALAIGGTTFAQGPGSGGCSSCGQCGQSAGGGQDARKTVESDPFRKFRLDTLDLRQEMMNRRFELQRENLKATPDSARIAGIKADITAIQVKISQVRLQSGLPDEGKRDGECFKMDGSCFRPDGTCNKQNGAGNCNGQPCWQR